MWSFWQDKTDVSAYILTGTHLKVFIIWSSAGPDEWIQPISLDLASLLLRWPCFSSTYSQRIRACSHLLLLVYRTLSQTHRLHMLRSFSLVCLLWDPGLELGEMRAVQNTELAINWYIMSHQTKRSLTWQKDDTTKPINGEEGGERPQRSMRYVLITESKRW